MLSKVVYEGWMVRYGRRKIGRSFIHMRYFVLGSRLLAYYKKKPQDNQVNFLFLLHPLKCGRISNYCVFCSLRILLLAKVEALAQKRQ